jgi:hypothetical protein
MPSLRSHLCAWLCGVVIIGLSVSVVQAVDKPLPLDGGDSSAVLLKGSSEPEPTSTPSKKNDCPEAKPAKSAKTGHAHKHQQAKGRHAVPACAKSPAGKGSVVKKGRSTPVKASKNAAKAAGKQPHRQATVPAKKPNHGQTKSGKHK